MLLNKSKQFYSRSADGTTMHNYKHMLVDNKSMYYEHTHIQKVTIQPDCGWN